MTAQGPTYRSEPTTDNGDKNAVFWQKEKKHKGRGSKG